MLLAQTLALYISCTLHCYKFCIHTLLYISLIMFVKSNKFVFPCSGDMPLFIPVPLKLKKVIMLYIDCELNGHKVKAFVDSGAQMTLISSSCAEKCNVARLIDKRFQGVAKGVGTQKILGRVHLLPLKIGEDHFPCTFSVLEHQPMDMLLGLDMLKRHQCVIDLKANCLKIGTTSTSAPFLAERDIPKSNEEKDSPSLPSASGESGGSAPSDESVSKLVDMGFTTEQAKKALLQCSNSVELAASLLFEKGGQL